MKRALISGAVLVAVATALAACGGAGGSSSSSGSASGTATVSAEQLGGGGSGAVLVTPSGHALYAAEQEKGGKVMCTGACVSFWKPLTLAAGTPTGSSLSGTLATVERPDGTKQVTYNGSPLYTFTQEGAGKVTGNGFMDAFGGQNFTWHVVHVDSTDDSSGSSGGGTGGNGAYGASGY
jgi:predicted lipoprotein with Yx(FWY)xxD motif